MTSSLPRLLAVAALCALSAGASSAAAQSEPAAATPVPAVADPAATAAPAPVAPADAVAPAAAPAAPPAASTPAAAGTEGLVGAPAEGKGQVVFFRPPAFTGMAISYKVREAEAELGTLGNGRYFVTSAEPGVHTYTVHSEAKDDLRLEVEPGETYYVTSSLTMGLVVGRPNISPSDKAAFDAVSKKLKPGKVG